MVNYKFQGSNNTLITTSATSVNILPAVHGGLKRTQLIIVNSSAAAIVTLAKGDSIAVKDAGIRLIPNAAYVEATDGGYTCFQGAIQAVSDIAGQLSITESFESD